MAREPSTLPAVQPETVKRFEEYQKAAVAGSSALRRFRETYWYYLVHKQI